MSLLGVAVLEEKVEVIRCFRNLQKLHNVLMIQLFPIADLLPERVQQIVPGLDLLSLGG